VASCPPGIQKQLVSQKIFARRFFSLINFHQMSIFLIDVIDVDTRLSPASLTVAGNLSFVSLLLLRT
jgi:hypothetical protein